ncbi:MAG: ankyrin repeat domain-containing protein [Candidatus Cardinium sp.]|nr:ankyrin repeat domain-containing protein [Candidatus Cardinium sp.]
MAKDNKKVDRKGFIFIGQLTGWLHYTRVLWIASLACLLQAKTCTREGSSKTSAIKLASARYQVEKIPDISQATPKKNNYLYEAVNEGDIAKVEAILERIMQENKNNKADRYGDFPNNIAKNGLTAVGLAIKQGKLNILKKLLACPYINVNEAGNSGKSLAYALSIKEHKIAQYLLDHVEAQTLDSTSALPKTRQNPLQLAIENNQQAIVKKILDRNSSNIDELWSKDTKKRTFLHTAASSNQLNTVLSHAYLQKDKSRVIKELFEKDSNGNSVLGACVLEGMFPLQCNKAKKHFIDLLTYMGGELNEERKEEIKREITALYDRRNILIPGRKITNTYGNELFAIVDRF